MPIINNSNLPLITESAKIKYIQLILWGFIIAIKSYKDITQELNNFRCFRNGRIYEGGLNLMYAAYALRVY